MFASEIFLAWDGCVGCNAQRCSTIAGEQHDAMPPQDRLRRCQGARAENRQTADKIGARRRNVTTVRAAGGNRVTQRNIDGGRGNRKSSRRGTQDTTIAVMVVAGLARRLQRPTAATGQAGHAVHTGGYRKRRGLRDARGQHQQEMRGGQDQCRPRPEYLVPMSDRSHAVLGPCPPMATPDRSPGSPFGNCTSGRRPHRRRTTRR
jgi:hypothetical protein